MSKNPLLTRGMCNPAWEAYEAAFISAGIEDYATRLTQGIGNAPASHGYHAADGILDGHAYTAAADIRVRDLSNTQIATILQELCERAWVVFFRNWKDNVHAHCNYAGVPQKRQLDSQNEDFFAGRDGLTSHSRINDEFWYPTQSARAIPEAAFRKSNPKTGPGVVVRATAVAPISVVRAASAAPIVPSNELYLGDNKAPSFSMPVIAGTSYAPVRLFGRKLGIDVIYDAATKTIKYDKNDMPIPLKIIAGEGYAPIRLLANELGLQIDATRIAEHRVRVHR